MTDDDHEITISPLCQDYSEGDLTVSIEIYCGSDRKWILEVLDPQNNSIVWTDTFATDQAAMDEFRNTVSRIGLPGLIAGDDG